MAQNKSKGSAGAGLEHDFPIQTFSLKPFLAKTLLPLLYPLFLNYAFMFLGWPGVGKTPAIIIMTLAMGRYHKEKLDLPTLPGRRRAKSLDNFRHRVRQVREGVFLDDPYRDKIEESQRCQGRYNDVKLAKNCCRAYASDDIQKDDEPKNDERIDITMEEFMKLVHRTFPGDKPADISDIMAMLRRTVVFVFGLSALYVRFPSEKSESPIHCIQVDDLHKDVLAEGDKLFYGKYKSGSVDKPEHYDESVGREQSMIAESMSRYLSYSKSTQYMLDINEELLECLFNIRASNIRETWLPSSQESQDESSQVLPPPVYRHVEGAAFTTHLLRPHEPERRALQVKWDLTFQRHSKMQLHTRTWMQLQLRRTTLMLMRRLQLTWACILSRLRRPCLVTIWS